MTRNELALLLENEAHNAAAEMVRGGASPREVCRSLRTITPRYNDAESRNATGIFEAIANGDVLVSA